MRKRLYGVCLVVVLATSTALAGGNLTDNGQTREITFIKDNQRTPDVIYQYELRNQASWQNYLSAHPQWMVVFNEENQMPHRAFGSPIATTGASYEDKAMNFITDQLSDFNIPVADIVHSSTPGTSKNTWVNYTQWHNGFEVLFSRMMVKFNLNDEVIQWSAEVFDDIAAPSMPVLSTTDASAAAQVGLVETITGVTVSSDLKILPIPGNKEYSYKLVYEVWVEGLDWWNIPVKYWTLVDSESGEVLYRQNFVVHHDASTPPPPGGAVEVQVEANIYPTHSYNPSSLEGLPNLTFTASGSHVTDGTGYVNTGLVSPTTGNFTLSGTWSIVRTGGTTPSGSMSLGTTLNTFNFDTDANIRENTAYYHVNKIHDYHKSIFSVIGGSFNITGMDWALPTNVDVAGSCNAFYDGTSINFYQEDLTCLSYATVADVVYHEYGHGINDNFYSDNGSFFINGAMGEGYADVWGYAEAEDPILGDGGSATDPTDAIRVYNADPKVYPVDIIGEVHADGEIIAGAWWDTYVNLGNDMPAMMNLFALCYPGFQAQTANGNEGQAFTDVLLDALEADDDNGDLFDGTPNLMAICEAFDRHGITLLSNGDMSHTGLEAAAQSTAITVTADYINTLPYLNFLQDVTCYYRLNSSPTWNSVAMPNIGGNTYEGTIPGQPQGTIIAYYVAATDIWGKQSAINPIGANAVEPTLPYFIMVDWDLMLTEDVDFSGIGSWDEGVPGDNATTGAWEAALPIGSFGTPGDASTMVAPDYQHTPGGTLCFVTQNASNASQPIGSNDVDGGTTTLRSSIIDLSAYSNPAVTYYRWYDNNPASGANPGADWWQVQVSDDGGSTWTYVEDTRISGKSWQRFAFRVQDYVTVNNQFRIKFNVSDSIRLGEYLDGGSLIEAALDDIQIWEEGMPTSVNDMELISNVNMFPNPASSEVNVQFDMAEVAETYIEVTNALGEIVYEMNLGTLNKGYNTHRIPTESWSEGNYMVNVVVGSRKLSKSITVVR